MLNMMQRVGVRAPILLLGGVAVTLTLEPVLTLVLLSVLPLIALVVFFVSRKGVGLFSAMQRSVDALVRTVREDVTGIRIIKALSRTEGEKARFDGVNRAVSRRETAASTTMALSNPAINFFLGAGLTGVILVGAFRVDSGLTQPGTILAFLSYFTIILGAMLSITRVFVMYSKGAASAARIQEVLAAEGEPETLAAAAPDRGAARLSFEGVTFSYGGGEPAVEDISFSVGPGQTLGIIGATGSGKSTLCNLMLRFYTPDKGVIRLDGRDIRAIPLKELRSRFGVVFQNDLLFGRTVAENIDLTGGSPPTGPRRPPAGPRPTLSPVWRGALPTRWPPGGPTSPAGSGSGCWWPGPWPATPTSSSSTTPPPPWTTRPTLSCARRCGHTAPTPPVWWWPSGSAR